MNLNKYQPQQQINFRRGTNYNLPKTILNGICSFCSYRYIVAKHININSWLNSQQGHENFLLCRASKLTLRFVHPLLNEYRGEFSTGKTAVAW